LSNPQTLHLLTLQRFCFSTIMLFLLVRVHNMKLWRGDGALDMDVSPPSCADACLLYAL
jgi:hypothetical protein